ncbi:DUF881 domain-containing protein [uncultured Jatrophihabitans sp.]|uniref:DUF881 domain-containing protein n=1 Tax=uncultured Jatrophihabitans sp. TaxID=1610747 RepID=UPI0035C95721
MTGSGSGDQRPRRLLAGRHTSAAVIGVLTLLLGFAIAVQVHANSSTDSLAALRDDDLIGILDNQDNRADRLRQQQTQLQTLLLQLQDSGNRSAAARKQALAQQQALGVLLGTVPATGPGVTLTVTDPQRKLDGEDLLDVVEELRGAGAEAISAGSVRVGVDTAFVGDPGAVQVDGVPLTAPYRFVAIGDATTLDTALNIPGGVASSVRTVGGELTVVEHRKVDIEVTRTLPKTRYAKPGK